MSKHHPTVRFVRYADDIVMHCSTREEAEAILTAIRRRLEEVKLRMNEEKTRIVYCQDYRRRGKHEHVKFGFLGFSFQPRQAQSNQNPGTSFTAFTAEISRENQKKIRDAIKEGINWRNTTLEISDIAEKLNAKVRGWINYFGCYGKKRLRLTFIYLDMRMVKWLKNKHRIGTRKALRRLAYYQTSKPNMFYHWQKGLCVNVNEITRAV